MSRVAAGSKGANSRGKLPKRPRRRVADDPSKPAYRVPSMKEIAALPPVGRKVVSTFSGCGGSCLGFEMDGYEIAWASEFVPAAQEVYRLNHPGAFLSTGDIRTVTAEQVLAESGLGYGEVDVLEGSPPCASFSTAGKREKGWGKVKKYSDTSQRADDLFFEYIRLLEGLQPKAFVAENVSGLVKGSAKGYFKEILLRMKAAGYSVSARLLNASYLGVPQARQRLIFVGVRGDLVTSYGVEPVHPSPLPYSYTVRDALPHLKRVIHDTSGERGQGDITDEPSPTVTVGMNSINSYHFRVEEEEGGKPAPNSLHGTSIGREWDRLRPGESSDKYFNLVRPHPDQPSPTVTQLGGVRAMAGVTHPTERRKFTIEELKQICAFPPDFKLTGTYAQQWERLGRAVPPVMMFHVARALRQNVFDRLPEGA